METRQQYLRYIKIKKKEIVKIKDIVKKKNLEKRHGKNLFLCSAVILSLCLSFVSCDNFEYHPYASDFYGRTAIHATALKEITELCEGKDTVCFAFVTDTQGSYDELEGAVDYIKKRDDVMFVIHGGDQSDFGLRKEFLWCRDIMDNLHKPYVCVIGNHDCLGTGEHTFDTLYGVENFSFNASFVHFVGLNTIALEYDYSNPVPDFMFMEDDINATLDTDSLTNTVVFMHAPPYDEQFNNNVAKVFHRYVRAYPGLRDTDPRYDDTAGDKVGTMKNGICLNGHTHRTDVKNIFDDGVLYYGLVNMEHRALQIYTITKDGYEVETITF